MDFLFDSPLLLAGPVLIGAIVALGWFRRHQIPCLRFGDGNVEFGAGMLASTFEQLMAE